MTGQPRDCARDEPGGGRWIQLGPFPTDRRNPVTPQNSAPTQSHQGSGENPPTASPRGRKHPPRRRPRKRARNCRDCRNAATTHTSRLCVICRPAGELTDRILDAINTEEGPDT